MMADMIKPAVYLDGEPQNLEAAASDALEWLRLTLQYIKQIRGQSRWASQLEEDRDRLARAIESIESFLPQGQPIFKRSGEASPVAPFEVYAANFAAEE